MRALLFVLLAFAMAGPAAAEEPQVITGRAVAIDGDTLLIDGERVRLWGISAPEMKDWPHGARARAWLDDITYGLEMRCQVIDRDRYKRPVARCFNDEHDVGSRMLLAGHAVVYRLYTAKAEGELAEAAQIYDELERRARKMGNGVWRGAIFE